MNLSKSWGKQQTKQRALVDIGPWANALMNNPFTHKKRKYLTVQFATKIRSPCVCLYLHFNGYIEKAMQVVSNA